MKVKIIKEQVRPRKTLFVFDFDDTLAHTDSVVRLQRGGEVSDLDSGAFASYEYQPDDRLDFSDFGRVDGQLIASTLAILNDIQRKGKDAVIVTARPPEAVEGIQKFFTDNNMVSPDIYATAGSANKPQVMIDLLSSGDYNHVVVYEDCMKNIEKLGDVVRQQGIEYSAVCINKDTTMSKVYQETTMRLTRQQLTTIIKEELQAVLDEMLSQEQEDKLAPLCRDPDSVETAVLSAEELGYKRPNFCFHMARKEFDELIGRRRTRDEDKIIRKIFIKFKHEGLYDFIDNLKRLGVRLDEVETKILSLVFKNTGAEGVINFLKREKLVLIDRSELVGFNPRETYLTHQDLEAIFKMFNPPEHEREEDEDLGGVMTTFADQSNERVQMLFMLAKFTSKLKVSRASSVDEQRFHEEDFGGAGEVPENIEFYN